MVVPDWSDQSGVGRPRDSNDKILNVAPGRSTDYARAEQLRLLRIVGCFLMAGAVCTMLTLFFVLPLPTPAKHHPFPAWTYTLGRTTIGVFTLGLVLSLTPTLRRLLRRRRSG